MPKQYRLELTYDMICREFIHKYPSRSIQILEKILFLIQEESLETWQKPFLKTKINVYKGTIQIKYISDLLRVTKLITSGVASISASGIPYVQPVAERLKMEKYIKIYNRYAKLSDEEVEEKVREILAKSDLDPKYYIFEKYENKLLRCVVRIDYNRKKSFFRNFMWTFLSIASMFCILTIIILGILAIFNLSLFKNVSDLVQGVVMMLMILIPCIRWLYKWTKPTEYEKENHYDI